MNRTFKGIVPGHKMAVAGRSWVALPFCCLACVGVFAGAALILGILGSGAISCLKRGSLGNELQLQSGCGKKI